MKKIDGLFNMTVLERIFHIPKTVKLCLLKYFSEYSFNILYSRKSEYQYTKLFWEYSLCQIAYFMDGIFQKN